MSSTLERRQQIVWLAQQQGKVIVDELAGRFRVSSVTVRNDLNHLSKKGFLVRCHGGAVVNSKLAEELSVEERYNDHRAIKMCLGRAVSERINNGEFIFLDSGTTTEEVARCLSNHNNLTVMTNGLNVANVLARFRADRSDRNGGRLAQKNHVVLWSASREEFEPPPF